MRRYNEWTQAGYITDLQAGLQRECSFHHMHLYVSNCNGNGWAGRSEHGVINPEVWMTIWESGWNLWVWLVGMVSRRWVWLVGGTYGYGYHV